MGADKESGMSNCEHTGLSIPECACNRCIERQLDRFAPEMLKIAPGHDLLLREGSVPVNQAGIQRGIGSAR